MKRCLGAPPLEPPVALEALSFLDLTERERFLVEANPCQSLVLKSFCKAHVIMRWQLRQCGLVLTWCSALQERLVGEFVPEAGSLGRTSLSSRFCVYKLPWDAVGGEGCQQIAIKGPLGVNTLRLRDLGSLGYHSWNRLCWCATV